MGGKIMSKLLHPLLTQDVITRMDCLADVTGS